LWIAVLAAAAITVPAGWIGVVLASTDEPRRAIEQPTLEARVDGIWVSADEIARLPTEGPAWDRLAEYALADWGDPALADQNSNHDVHTLAGALYAARLEDPVMTDRVVDALTSVEGTWSYEILALSRNLLSYVIAADVIGYRSPTFASWLEDNLDRRGHSRAGIDTLFESALRDPSNHGAHARASVVAVALYLGDDDTVGIVAARFRNWLGRPGGDFEWRELDWQADPQRPRGINSPGSRIGDVNVDGVLPEEERRSGGFTDPPPQERYVWEALQGTIATAQLLDRAGFDTWEWEDRAILRAFVWLYDENRYPAEGDDRWIPWVVNARYGDRFPVETPTRPGKNVGFTDWTHGL
jgi:hypothetical protein